MNTRTQRAIKEALVIATVITGALIAVTMLLTDDPMNWFETAAVFFSFASTWLCTRQVRFNYLFALIATALLSYVFFTSRLYGSMALNLYLIPTVIYGWFMWGKDTNTRPVMHVTAKASLLYAGFTALTWVGVFFTIKALGGTMGALDGWLLVGSILAQYLMDRKKIENWIIWGLVNMVSIYVYFSNGLYLLAAQFLFFFANAVYAYIQWRKDLVPADAKAVDKKDDTFVIEVGAPNTQAGTL